MVNLIGNSTCKLDDKSRLSLPAKLLYQLEGLQEQDWFIMKPSLELQCIELYPKVNWDHVQKDLMKLDGFRPEVKRFLLWFMRDHQLVKLDKSNRLLIPQQLLDFANIKKEVVLAPVLEVIQIWDEETYKLNTAELPADYRSLTNTALDKRNV